MHEYMIQVMIALPPERCQAALNQFAVQGWQLASSQLQVMTLGVAGDALCLYTIWQRKKLSLQEGAAG